MKALRVTEGWYHVIMNICEYEQRMLSELDNNSHFFQIRQKTCQYGSTMVPQKMAEEKSIIRPLSCSMEFWEVLIVCLEESTILLLFILNQQMVIYISWPVVHTLILVCLTIPIQYCPLA